MFKPRRDIARKGSLISARTKSFAIVKFSVRATLWMRTLSDHRAFSFDERVENPSETHDTNPRDTHPGDCPDRTCNRNRIFSPNESLTSFFIYVVVVVSTRIDAVNVRTPVRMTSLSLSSPHFTAKVSRIANSIQIWKRLPEAKFQGCLGREL